MDKLDRFITEPKDFSNVKSEEDSISAEYLEAYNNIDKILKQHNLESQKEIDTLKNLTIG